MLKEAVGVCAIVTPWNFPNAMITRKSARPGAGCTFHQAFGITPLSALALGVLAERGASRRRNQHRHRHADRDRQIEMMANETVRKISFTGSTRAVRY